MMANTILVKRLELDWDCRRIHALRAIAERANLKPREIILAFNTAMTMARAVNSEGLVLSDWDEDGFDVDLLLNGREESFGISFRMSRASKIRRRGKVIPIERLRVAA